MTPENEVIAPVEVPVKAYDVKVLVAKLKARGLDVAEDMAMVLIDEVSAWVVESAVISENKVDDIAALGMPELVKIVKQLADKIDGKDEI